VETVKWIQFSQSTWVLEPLFRGVAVAMASRDVVSSLMEIFAEGSAEFTIGRLSYVYGPIQKMKEA